MASGICLFAGWLFDDLGAGLIASLGAFVALYGSGRPYSSRARLLGLAVCGLVFSVVAGVEAATRWQAMKGPLLFLLAQTLPVPLGLDAYVPIPASNPLTQEKVKMGKRLFSDTRLSVDGSISCATCFNVIHCR